MIDVIQSAVVSVQELWQAGREFSQAMWDINKGVNYVAFALIENRLKKET